MRPCERVHGGATMDAADQLAHPAREPVADSQVGDGGQRNAKADQEVRVADEPVAQVRAALGNDVRPVRLFVSAIRTPAGQARVQ